MTQWGLDTLFNPAKRHMDEEKRRLQSTRAELGDNSGGKRIDLEAGKVTIRRDTESDTEQTDEVDGAAIDGAAIDGTVATPDDDETGAEPAREESGATRRARLRRAGLKSRPADGPKTG